MSVAIATYNGEKHMAEQLASICRQTYRDFEIVVSDDCSTDRTVEILRQFLTRANLRVILNDQRVGFVRNFERAIAACRGSYITLCDQDDIWFDTRLDALVPRLGDAMLIYGYAEQYIDVDGALRRWYPPEGLEKFLELHGHGRHIQEIIAANWVVSHTVLFRAELTRLALPFPPNQTFHDHWLAIVAASTARGISHNPQQHMLYRRNEGSVTWLARDNHISRWWSKAANDTWKDKNSSEVSRLRDIGEAQFFDQTTKEFTRKLSAFYRQRNPFKRGMMAWQYAPHFWHCYGQKRRAIFAAREFVYALLYFAHYRGC